MPRTRDEAVRMLSMLCQLTVGPGYLAQVAGQVQQEGLTEDLATGQSDRLYAALMGAFSMQGISDAIALGYIARHGNATRARLAADLGRSRCACPKLAGFDAYQACRYRKTGPDCARPQHLRLCPVRKLPLRKGLLNVQAYALHFFLRDVCGDDVSGFIDRIIAAARDDAAGPGANAGPSPRSQGPPAWVPRARLALVAELSRVDGVSSKLANMVLADLLLGGRPDDHAWRQLGAAMRAVDVLVHKFLERSGTLDLYGRPHRYGPRCYGAAGCDGVLHEVALEMTAEAIDPGYPAYFPRLIELAIWRFCAEPGHGLCRSQAVGKGPTCRQRRSCPVAHFCAFARPPGTRRPPRPG